MEGFSDHADDAAAARAAATAALADAVGSVNSFAVHVRRSHCGGRCGGSLTRCRGVRLASVGALCPGALADCHGGGGLYFFTGSKKRKETNKTSRRKIDKQTNIYSTEIQKKEEEILLNSEIQIVLLNTLYCTVLNSTRQRRTMLKYYLTRQTAQTSLGIWKTVPSPCTVLYCTGYCERMNECVHVLVFHIPYPLPVWGGGHQLCNEHEGSGGDRICGTPVVGVVVLEFIKLRRQVADNLPPYKPGVLVLLTIGSILKVIDINVFEWAHILVLLLSTSL